MINKIKTAVNQFAINNGRTPDAVLISVQSYNQVKSDLLNGNHIELAGVDVRQDDYLKGDAVIPVCQNECLSFIDKMFGGDHGQA